MKLIYLFWDIVLFQAGPQDLPASRFLLNITLVLSFILGLALSLFEQPLFDSVITNFIEILLLLFTVWLYLSVRGLPQRFIQTATALSGIELLYGVILLPLFWALTEIEQWAVALAMLISLLSIMSWMIVVVTFIFKQALEVKWPMAFFLTGFYILLSMAVSELLPVGTN